MASGALVTVCAASHGETQIMPASKMDGRNDVRGLGGRDGVDAGRGGAIAPPFTSLAPCCAGSATLQWSAIGLVSRLRGEEPGR